ncbi:MAG: 2-keto-4-pentenoate hydratase/2-oxohepta-3-ene-1,7-dioic acid hydratase in catechol pathway [Gammaproteobacteria bacterium]|jgi:2-keto-4-pentenoate hydratase/2-oxohepta-3-ene-1,7-dioic acid hydratase in catechol pathway
MQLILDQQAYPHVLGKVVCVGRNYAAHAKELNNPIPDSPILFIKPASSVVPFGPDFSIPKDQGRVHHELEIAILIGKALSHASTEHVAESIAGFGLGLDLTLRDVQDRLKEKGHPWERAKSFDGACPLTRFVSLSSSCKIDQPPFGLTLKKNGQLQQQGSSADMLFPILPLIAHISAHFNLQPGDVILTGTPAGVGPLEAGDSLSVILSQKQSVLLTQQSVVL